MQVRRPETTQVANYLLDRLGKGQVTAELLQPDELISGMMAQVAAEPDMAQLLSGFIYSSEGPGAHGPGFMASGTHRDVDSASEAKNAHAGSWHGLHISVNDIPQT